MRLILYCFALVLALAAFSVGGRAQTPAPSCPSVFVESRVKNPYWITGGPGICPGVKVIFTAAVTGVGPNDEPKFSWTVSSGEIIDGQGTSSITVQTKEGEEQSVTANVRVGGVSASEAGCDVTGSATMGPAMCCLPPCPVVSIQCPTEIVEPGKPFTVSAHVAGGDPELELTYNWSVSAGVIISGQGTLTITVDTTRLAGNSVTATLEIGGLPPECDRTESCTPPVSEYSSPGADGETVSLIRRRLRSPALGFCGLSGN